MLEACPHADSVTAISIDRLGNGRSDPQPKPVKFYAPTGKPAEDFS